MNGFFQSWQKKAGVVAMAAACVFVTGWVSSLSITQALIIPTSPGSAVIAASLDRHIILIVEKAQDTRSIPKTPHWHTGTYSTIESEITNQVIAVRFFGIGLIAAGDAADGMLVATLPYWSIVIPLTLISVWLLFHIQGQSTPQTNSALATEIITAT